VRVDRGEARPHPVRAVLLALVHDDADGVDAGGDEVPDDGGDERYPGHGEHRLRRRDAPSAKPAALSGGDDTAGQCERSIHSSSSSSSPSERSKRSPGQHGALIGATSPTSQTCRIPMARAPAMSRGRESPTKTTSAGASASSSSALWKMRGSGFEHPTRVES